MVKVNAFLKNTVKVEIDKNDGLTFPNGFLDLSRLLPTFQGVGKVTKTTTFPTFTPYLIGVKLKSRYSQVESNRGQDDYDKQSGSWDGKRGKNCLARQ